VNWEDALARQPGGNGPRVIELSGDFIAAMLRLGFPAPVNASAALSQPKQTTARVSAKSKGRP
jgi:hypothetical protein